MDAAGVAAVRPDAVPGDGQRLHDGAECKLRIPHFELTGHDYSVLFYFRDDALVQVTVATNGAPMAGDFHSIANALRLRYGREVAFRESPDSFSTGDWLSADGVNVALVFHGEIGCLNVNFQYRYAGAAMAL